MIKRYSREKMTVLFEDKTRYEHFLQVELAALEALEEAGMIPNGVHGEIRSKARVDVTRIKEIEEETKHDVIAFTRALGETLGKEKQWFHYGLTSTDVVDTAFALTVKKANDLIEAGLDAFLSVLETKAKAYKNTPCIGRTHGIHADITVFGLKFALWTDIFKRHRARFKSVRERIETGKLSGAVGNHAHLPPRIQDRACEILGIGSAAISTQVLPRDIHSEYVHVLSLIASGIEQIALEVRHLQRTEVSEVSEAFFKKQKGSSAMPHKKNPIASENMCGCARMMRGYVHSVGENVALWHERDISHSSVERVVIPDALTLLDYMLDRYGKVLSQLVVDEKRMLENIGLTHGVIYSQRVLSALIAEGLSREEAYDMIQPLAIEAYEHRRDFKALLEKDGRIPAILGDGVFEDCFDLAHFLKATDAIYKRVGIV